MVRIMGNSLVTRLMRKPLDLPDRVALTVPYDVGKSFATRLGNKSKSFWKVQTSTAEELFYGIQMGQRQIGEQKQLKKLNIQNASETLGIFQAKVYNILEYNLSEDREDRT